MDRLARERVCLQQVVVDQLQLGGRQQPVEVLDEAPADALVILVRSLRGKETKRVHPGEALQGALRSIHVALRWLAQAH